MVCTLVLWLTALLSLFVKYANTSQCAEKCNCLWVRGKLTADCNGLALNKLPKISDTEFASNIHIINLTRNNLVELKRHIFFNANLVNLQRIFLQKVGLERIDENAFYRLSNLIELDLSFNALKYIPMESFSPLKMLRSLDLASNHITSIPKETFVNLTNLKTLSLSRNRLTYIDSDAFNGLKNLESLKLSGNHLTNIAGSTLSPLVKLHSLTLSENKWQCDCKMRPFRKYLLSNARINIPDEPKCESNHKTLMLLGLDSFLCPPVILMDFSSNITNVVEGSTLKLECAVLFESEENSQLLKIDWKWKNTNVRNLSNGCADDCRSANASDYYFVITRTVVTHEHYIQKVEISRLKLSSVRSINSGSYECNAHNSAGNAQKKFMVIVEPRSRNGKESSAAASVESQHYNYTNYSHHSNDDGTDRVVIGLVLGILFGILLVLALFGISIVLLCRRRQLKPNNINGFINMSDNTELEKLTTNSISATIVNPIQKPPRLLQERANDYSTPEVWLIKRINGSNNIMKDSGDVCTQLLMNDSYNRDTQTPITDISMEPDLLHPSAYVRNKQHFEDVDGVSINSDGTEV